MMTATLTIRVNAALLAGTLCVAILQNVLARRDPQLAILYVLIMVALVFFGGGRFSLDALVFPEHGQVAVDGGSPRAVEGMKQLPFFHE